MTVTVIIWGTFLLCVLPSWFIVIVALLYFLYQILLLNSQLPAPLLPQEQKFKTPSGKEEHFPLLLNDNDDGIKVSIIVPAFNEEKRIIKMLNETSDHMKQLNIKYEIIIVDDGSDDQTSKVSLDYQEKDKNIRVMKLLKNRGKGGAVIKVNYRL